ncbi:neuronal acetylcholine receptor subunit alpha-10-like isoform X2 [Ruditapes philippinarum]|uniref:neuronal acetylcholine receptor subunit alpha-10-like isoform X2 n=1 Tax=Ruditapes philippinarum TaxID=129788 RepID=UPI00295B47A5|nr:neuronal acetylcholine receptor subunit alpha-10-like isoform X2 [Ruditapes philippinarum]
MLFLVFMEKGIVLLLLVDILWILQFTPGCGDEMQQYCLSRFHDVPEEDMTQEQRLLYRLMKSYDRASRPVFDAKQPVLIKLGISLTQVLDVDEKNQVLTTNVWLDQEWYDERLVWTNVSEFADINILRIPCDLIWLPDIILYNSVDNHNKGYMKSLAMVQKTGHVFWPPIVRMRSSCKMDITFFPFDDQICKMKLGSWAYDGFQVDVSNRSLEIDLTNFVDNGEWTLINTKVQRNVIYYPCCPEPFPDVTFYVQLRRRVLYYFLNVIIPCMLLSSLTLTGFLLPPDSGEKITLGLTVLLAFSVFMLLIAENMPPTSEYIPLIGIYLTIIMAMSALSVVFSVFVLNFHHKRSGSVPPAPWIKAIAHCASILTCTTLTFNSDVSIGTKFQRNTQREHNVAEYNLINVNQEEETETCDHLMDIHTNTQCSENHRGVKNSNNNTNGRSHLPIVENILADYVNKVLSGYDRLREDNQVMSNWKEIARVFDRVLFVLFALITASSTVVLLVICPMTKEITIEDFMNEN